ncbi:MAG: FIST C-terminal domain-containing protein [Proteobacteria bacterium]|nr:FIST C-terminal domain-containing protein [Pseudomonadota bacterium]
MFKTSHAADAAWPALLSACLTEIGPLEGNETLGLLYVTEHLAPDLEAILAEMRTRTGILSWAGSVGLGVCAGGREYFDRPAMAMMLTDLLLHEFQIMPTAREFSDMDFSGGNLWAAGDQPPFALVHADSNFPGVAHLIDEIAEATSGFLVGGLTASNFPNHQIAVGVTGGGISGVLFSPAVEVMTSLSQGCTPLGASHEITRADDNILMEIDGEPAFDVFSREIGEVLTRDLNRAAGYIHAALPVAGSDTGDYVVRNLVGIDRGKGWVAIAAPVVEGDRILFVRRDPAAARGDLETMVTKLKARAGNPPRGGVYISCVARGPHMFGEEDAEMGLVKDTLGDVPVIGFYANGEISSNRLYAYTGVLTLFF